MGRGIREIVSAFFQLCILFVLATTATTILSIGIAVIIVIRIGVKIYDKQRDYRGV